jgi:hypothetical protein
MDFDQTWYMLVLKRIWTLLIFKVIGQRSRSPGQFFRRGDTPRFVLPLLSLFFFSFWFHVYRYCTVIPYKDSFWQNSLFMYSVGWKLTFYSLHWHVSIHKSINPNEIYLHNSNFFALFLTACLGCRQFPVCFFIIKL